MPGNLPALKATIVLHRHPSVQNSGAVSAMYIQGIGEEKRMSLTPLPHIESYGSYFAVMDEPSQYPALELLKSLDDLDEEEDEDDDEEDDDIEDLEDEEDEEDLDEDYEDDEDDDEDEDEEDDDEDGGVKPLKMA
jgi:hypothetical protein